MPDLIVSVRPNVVFGPLFPDVPMLPGVPRVLRDAALIGLGTQAMLKADAARISQIAASQWGIYTKGGALALDPDSINAVGFDAEYRLADFPIEKGGFETYDKVQMPFECSVQLAKGGTRSEREAFLALAERLRGNRELYNVVTPEATWRGVNIVRVSIERNAESGAGLIVLNLRLREVRQTVKASFAETKDPASASPASNGSTQPVTPSASVVTAQQGAPIK